METEEKKFLKLRERAKKLGINLHWKFRGFGISLYHHGLPVNEK
jgi:hypothetical protein